MHERDDTYTAATAGDARTQHERCARRPPQAPPARQRMRRGPRTGDTCPQHKRCNEGGGMTTNARPDQAGAATRPGTSRTARERPPRGNRGTRGAPEESDRMLRSPMRVRVEERTPFASALQSGLPPIEPTSHAHIPSTGTTSPGPHPKARVRPCTGQDRRAPEAQAAFPGQRKDAEPPARRP